MSDFEKQLHKSVSGVKLSAAEKRELKARVVSYMEYHPRRESVAVQKAADYLESQPYTILSFDNVYLRSIVGAFALLLFVFVPTIAEKAVPGDMLYPVKVRINEEIRGTLTFSAADKVAWETERLERRIAEVRLLASEGKLTDEVEAAAVVAVKAHAEAAQQNINKLKDTDADEASMAEVEFESALAVQSAVLDADQGVDSEESDDLAMVVREAQATVVATKSTIAPSYPKISARLEAQTTRAYELFASLIESGVVSDEEHAEIERRLEDIERAIAANTEAVAVVAVQEEADVDASVSDEVIEITQTQREALLVVLADIKKLISFMTDIDVRGSVELEELVPVVPTEEERQSSVDAVVNDAYVVLRDARALMDDASVEWEEGVLEKIAFAVDLLDAELVFVVTTITEDGAEEMAEISLAEKEGRVEGIVNLTESLRSLLNPWQDQIVLPDEEVDEEATTTPDTTEDPDIDTDVDPDQETEEGTSEQTDPDPTTGGEGDIETGAGEGEASDTDETAAGETQAQ